ncbi:STAS domain-containing protein [Streptomyces broussonetiae]|uniref:STAS domain-containing protein n=1 Tax=Streptomyces broussonetiae TaxID=2686304 RepID=A0A6I6MR14_9ACTN|nr:STAS domain-containing protein [Streptomyces broussonetiae]QHA02948.1 STAS domain-containing protein [Streptomyces broussonetiae]
MAENHRAHVAAADSASRCAADGATLVTLSGEVDVLTAPALSERLDTLTADMCLDLWLDVRAVDFIDCTGLGVLCRARSRLLARQGRLRLVTGDAGFGLLRAGAALAVAAPVCGAAAFARARLERRRMARWDRDRDAVEPGRRHRPG